MSASGSLWPKGESRRRARLVAAQPRQRHRGHRRVARTRHSNERLEHARLLCSVRYLLTTSARALSIVAPGPAPHGQEPARQRATTLSKGAKRVGERRIRIVGVRVVEQVKRRPSPIRCGVRLVFMVSGRSLSEPGDGGELSAPMAGPTVPDVAPSSPTTPNSPSPPIPSSYRR